MLIACANIANLLTANLLTASVRFAIRMSP